MSILSEGFGRIFNKLKAKSAFYCIFHKDLFCCFYGFQLLLGINIRFVSLIKCETQEKCEVNYHRYGSKALNSCVKNRRFNYGFKIWSNQSNVTEYDNIRGHSLFPNNFHAIPDLNGTDETVPQDKELWVKYDLDETSWYVVEMDKNSYEMFAMSITKNQEPTWGYVNLVHLSEFRDSSFVVVERDLFFKKKTFRELVG